MKTGKPITRDQLAHSLKLCHRIEDAAWREFVALGATERTSAIEIRFMAVAVGNETAPAWCEQDAWVRIVDSFVAWSICHGNLQIFWSLRRKKDSHEQGPSDT